MKFEAAMNLAIIAVIAIAFLWVAKKLGLLDKTPPDKPDLEKGTQTLFEQAGNVVSGAIQGTAGGVAHVIEENGPDAVVPGEAPALWDMVKDKWDDFWGIAQNAGLIGPGISDQDKDAATTSLYDSPALDAITVSDSDSASNAAPDYYSPLTALYPLLGDFPVS